MVRRGTGGISSEGSKLVGEGRCNEGFDGPTRCRATVQKLMRRKETRPGPKLVRIWAPNDVKQPVGGSQVGNGKKVESGNLGRRHFRSLADAKTFYQIEIINEKTRSPSLLLHVYFPSIHFLESSI